MVNQCQMNQDKNCNSDTSSPQIVKSGNSEFLDSDAYLAVTYEEMV